MAEFIVCCQQCEQYQTVRLPESHRFACGFCAVNGQTLTREPVAVSIPRDCPRGLGYRGKTDTGEC